MSSAALFDFEFSMVAHGKGTTTTPCTFRKAIEDIRSDKWASQIARIREDYDFGGKEGCAKSKLAMPGFLFSGTFSYRDGDHLIHPTGVLCADLDELGGERVASMKELIAADPHTLAVFVSPTGQGLKVLYRREVGAMYDHLKSFLAVQHYVKAHFGLDVDKSCKEVNRLCYASYDPEAFAADDALLLPDAPEEIRVPDHTDFKPKFVQNYEGDMRPGDDYDLRGDLPALLLKHGWTQDGKKHWTRPGKNEGTSASLDYIPGRFWCFTSSTQFEPLKAYRPWYVYVMLEHGGDVRAAVKELARLGYGTPAKSRQQQNLERITGETEPVRKPAPTVLRPLFDFAVIPDGDASILLGERYLNRGDGMVIVSTSGMGKSAMCVQGATELALNRGPFGIQGNGPLKSLIIQSEDSDGDIGEVAYSIKTVLNLTPAQISEVNDRVKVVCDRVNRGQRFIDSLRALIAEFKPDLVWINPMQAFIDGDVTDSKDLGAFLREGLNSLNQPPSFGYIIIHHTTKPATGKERAERQWHEVMYDMAGGAEIINWARAILSLRATPKEGEFNLVLAKRGRRAGVTKKVPSGVGFVLEPVTIIPLQHAKGHIDVPGHKRGIPKIYWEPRITEDEPLPVKNAGGRTPTHIFDTYRTVFPVKSSKGATINELARLCSTNKPISPSALHAAAKRWEADGEIQIIRETGQPDRYRASV